LAALVEPGVIVGPPVIFAKSFNARVADEPTAWLKIGGVGYD
jgi:hypothetical protein